MAPTVFHLPFGGPGIITVSSAIRAVSSRTARKSSPLLLLNAPGTFSQTMNLGRILIPVLPLRLSISLNSLTIRICSMNSPDLAPANPARLPATDKSWHGLPPVTMSTGSRLLQSIFVMSPRCFMFGNRIFVTLMGNGSISDAHNVFIPYLLAARGNPPMPSNKLPNVIVLTSPSPPPASPAAPAGASR